MQKILIVFNNLILNPNNPEKSEKKKNVNSI